MEMTIGQEKIVKDMFVTAEEELVVNHTVKKIRQKEDEGKFDRADQEHFYAELLANHLSIRKEAVGSLGNSIIYIYDKQKEGDKETKFKEALDKKQDKMDKKTDEKQIRNNTSWLGTLLCNRYDIEIMHAHKKIKKNYNTFLEMVPELSKRINDGEDVSLEVIGIVSGKTNSKSKN